ncbi:GNAT family N-acetyltransferase [Paenibacillus mesophilus]|nr:GNAT family N-acetyltransferase [Paenibacillus mesophilus]
MECEPADRQSGFEADDYGWNRCSIDLGEMGRTDRMRRRVGGVPASDFFSFYGVNSTPCRWYARQDRCLLDIMGKFSVFIKGAKGGHVHMDNPVIRLGRLHQCTFEQALELRQRGFEGYHDEMRKHYPNFPQAAAPAPGALDRLLDGFGSEGIRPELSIVGYVNEKPVGFVFIAIKTVDGKKLAWNGGTGVFPEYRGYGLAKLMMQEAQRVIREQEVDRAVLEVVAKNKPAVTAYVKGGFRIADRIVGMTREEALTAPFLSGKTPEGVRLQYGVPADVARLPFYRDKVAWGCMWHYMKRGESLIVYDAEDKAIAYALFQRSRKADGQLQSVMLRQCEVSPERSDRDTLFRLLLTELYGPYDVPCVRKTGDLSMANPEPIRALEEAGFTLNYEQYLMLLEKEEESQ